MDTIALPTETSADLDLETAVAEVIRNLDILRPTHAEVDVAVSGGHVTLSGIVSSIFAVTEAVRAVQAVPGVTGVTSQLYDDGTITRQAAHALAVEAQTKDIPLGYQVTSLFGHLSVIGRFTPEQEAALMAVCQNIAGVRSVRVHGAN